MFRNLSPPQIVVISFFTAILVGAALLSMPFATKTGERPDFIDSLFTATSATCVTGLVVKDTGAYFSSIGQFIIIFLIQIGGLGIMTLSTLFAVLFGRKLAIKDDVVIQTTVAGKKAENLRALIKHIVFVTFAIEITGAALLILRWGKTMNWTLAELLANSAFHSVSAFCNAGFSLFSKNLAPFAKDPFINLTIISLIVLGGLGFVVILELPRLIKRKPNQRISIQTKMVLLVSFVLIAGGALILFITERTNTIASFGMKDKIVGSLFQSVTARTAGFNTLNIEKFRASSLGFIIFLMFIGASPGSTGGGIKTSTFAVLIATFISMLKNRDRVLVFRKTIPKEAVRKSLVVFLLAFTWISIALFLLTLTESRISTGLGNSFLRMLFEVTSAFGTVGLSAGITPFLTSLGKLIIIVTMFIGRVGPLTLALSIAIQSGKIAYSYPEENIMIG